MPKLTKSKKSYPPDHPKAKRPKGMTEIETAAAIREIELIGGEDRLKIAMLEIGFQKCSTRNALDEHYNIGYDTGFEEGHQEGHQEGFAEGIDQEESRIIGIIKADNGHLTAALGEIAAMLGYVTPHHISKLTKKQRIIISDYYLLQSAKFSMEQTEQL